MSKIRPLDPVELAFKQGKPIDDAVKKAAKLAKKAHETREQKLATSGVREAFKFAR